MRITETDGVCAVADVSISVFYHMGARESVRAPQTLDPRVTIFLSITLLHCAEADSWAPHAAEIEDDSSHQNVHQKN